MDKNKTILQQQYAGFWEEINSNNLNEEDLLLDDIKIDAASTGEPTLCIKGLHVHSPRDPVREAQRLAESFAEIKSPVIVMGFGLGFAACAAASLGVPIIVVEKYKSLFLKAFELRDFSDFLSKNRIIFIVGGTGEGITNALSIANELIESQDESNIEKKSPPSIIRNRTLMSLDEQWYKTIEDKIRTWSMRDDVNAATQKRFGKRWVRNLTKNMSAIRDLPGVHHLANLANNLPVFLAAAGPSLDKIKPLLRDIYDRCIVIAVDTSLRFFTKNGIQPDFVLVVDPQFWNSRHLDRCICDAASNAICDTACEQTALIAESAVFPPVLNLPFKNKFLCGSLFPLGTFIEKQVDPKGRLGAGGSVATTAWDFARSLGAKEIWIAGLDLAFPGLKTHFRGARFEESANAGSTRFNPVEKWVLRALRDGFPFRATGVLGDQVLTDRRLSLYAAWFEAQFRNNPNVKNYGLFLEGLAISGLHAADTEKFLALPKRREEIDSRIKTIFTEIENEFNAPQEKTERAKRYDNAVSLLERGLKSIKTAALEGAEIARRALRYPLNPQQQNKVLKELDEITRRLTESDVKEVAGFLIPPINNEDGNEEKDKFRKYLKSSVKLFDGIIEAV
ncbi:MAG: DUF115 domain-containing protein [Treponema sp.]|nr:DUF115 domain-containing protein [Treponema sp.]